MFAVVIFHLFYMLVKICVVFVVELIVNVIPVKYGRELVGGLVIFVYMVGPPKFMLRLVYF